MPPVVPIIVGRIRASGALPLVVIVRLEAPMSIMPLVLTLRSGKVAKLSLVEVILLFRVRVLPKVTVTSAAAPVAGWES